MTGAVAHVSGRLWTTGLGATLAIRDGRIALVSRAPAADGGPIMFPAFVNAHDHGRGLPTADWGVPDAPLEFWIPSLALLPDVDLEASASVAFGRLAAAGFGATVHFHGTFDPRRIPDDAAAVSRAAERVGLRVAFVAPLRDANRLAYASPEAVLERVPEDLRATVARVWAAPVPAPEAQIELVAAAARRVNAAFVDVQYGPVGPQWCSEALLRGVARAAAHEKRRIHTHLFETELQRIWADRTYPQGYVRYLDDLGLLGPDTTVAHGVWLREDEAALLARRETTVVLNASSNRRLASGTADAAMLRRAGIKLAIGEDSLPLDGREDALRDLRLAREIDPEIAAGELVAMATWHGAYVAGVAAPAKGLVPGEPADIALVACPSSVDPGLALLDPAARIVETLVAGRPVMRDGRALAFDLDPAAADLAEAARVARSEPHPLAEALCAYREALHEMYSGSAWRPAARR